MKPHPKKAVILPRRPASPAPAPEKRPVPAAVEAAIAPPVLLPYQQSWVADQAQVKVWEKSRRIGASWCDASDSVLLAASEDGQDALYIGYSEDMAREYLDDCAMWARAFQRAASEVQEFVYSDEKTDIKAFRIDFASGHKVLALSSRPRSIRGKQGKVTIDEAAFHDELPELLKAALAMLIWGGRVSILSSHNGEDNAFNQLVREIGAGKAPYALHRTTFDDALKAGLFDRVKMILGKRLGYRNPDHSFHEIKARAEWRDWIYAQYGANAAEELDCIPRMGSGVYIPRMLVERCMADGIPVLHYAKPPEWVHDTGRKAETETWIADTLKPVIDGLPNVRSALGQDFGRSGDLSVIWVLQAHQGRAWRTAFVLELRCIPFDVQQQILFAIMDSLPLFHHAKFDARGNGQGHAEAALQKYGVARVECVMATASWYAANFPAYKAAYEDKCIIVPRSEDIIADHRRVILVKGNPTMDEGRDKGSDGGWRHGDSAIAGLLAWAATKCEAVPIEFQSLGRPRVFTGISDFMMGGRYG